MITEDYVNFETAKLLKEKGFNEACNVFYDSGYNHTLKFPRYGPCYLCDNDSVVANNGICAAPTLQMAMKWLRETHNLFIFISTWLRNKDGAVQYYYEIRNLNDKDFETIADSTVTEFDSPEKTCEAAIKYCLEKLI